MQTTEAALKVTTRPVIISHTGLDTQLGSNPRMAEMMRPRLIGKEQAKIVADAGGVIGVWTHLADTRMKYAPNIWGTRRYHRGGSRAHWHGHQANSGQ
ncbi:MAG: hypothetical protein JO033_20940 [Acidobacteriaceae bacterium]|nr:hypothetical protein [Acidobacteriaceae bacterium]